MDDVLVYNKNMAEHVKHLEIVLEILKQHQLVAKKSKCISAHNKLEYLGHIISDQGVSTHNAKTQAMAQWPVPTNVFELRGFLGLTGYYRKFVKHYSKPLTILLQKRASNGQLQHKKHLRN